MKSVDEWNSSSIGGMADRGGNQGKTVGDVNQVDRFSLYQSTYVTHSLAVPEGLPSHGRERHLVDIVVVSGVFDDSMPMRAEHVALVDEALILAPSLLVEIVDHQHVQGSLIEL